MSFADDPVPTVAFTVVDVETTGLEPEDRIVEVACLRIRGPREEGRFESLVNPGIHIPLTATAISGIDDAMVSGAPDFAQVWPAMEALLTGAVLVAHNAPFDLHFLSAERNRAGIGSWHCPVLDTLRLARNVLALPAYSLASLRSSLGLRTGPTHRAFGDVMTTAALLRRLIAELGGRVQTVGELIAAQEPIALPWEDVAQIGLPEDGATALAEAYHGGLLLDLDYESKAGSRRYRVKPLRLERNGPLLYLQATIERSGEVRTFRINRIRQVCRVANS